MPTYIYRGDLLDRRLALSRSQGFFLDYFLFINNEQTPKVFQVRPLALPQIMLMLNLDLKPRRDRALIRALAHDLERYRPLQRFLQPVFPAEDVIQGDNVSSAWRKVLDSIDHHDLVRRMVDSLLDAIKRHNFPQISFLSRRISSEINALHSSRRAMYNYAKRLFLSPGALEFFDENIYLLLTSEIKCHYNVTFYVTPYKVSQRERNVLKNNKNIILRTHAQVRYWTPLDEGTYLTGLVFSSHAVSPEDAVTRCRADARDLVV